ncbi:MAG: CDP-alcohol phosphatidyltransferase family protein [Dehalococcoidia bacterium]|nr:CDP-alcohol phosphatidyltransferase family protein [Dehalococcoidia bacterium]
MRLSRLLPRTAPSAVTLPVASGLAALGVTPNMVSMAGFLGNCAAAVLVAHGQFWQGGLAMLFFSLLDVFDGALARLTNRASPYGAVFDAVLDRASEAAVLLGVVIYYSSRDQSLEVVLAYAALAGSVMVSYVRARAEAAGVLIKEGLFTRFERVVLLGAGLVVGQVLAVLWILAILANLTALQRLLAVRRRVVTGD